MAQVDSPINRYRVEVEGRRQIPCASWEGGNNCDAEGSEELDFLCGRDSINGVQEDCPYH